MRPRPVPVVGSLALHVLGIMLAVSAPFGRDDNAIRKEDYRILPAPERKLIWHKLDNRLPDLSVGSKTALNPPRPKRRSNKVAIQASMLEAPPADQLIWQPATPQLTKESADLPNMAAFQPPPPPEAKPEPPKPEPPAPEPEPKPALLAKKPPPKKFRPPPETPRPKTAQIEITEPPPGAAVNSPEALGQLSAVVAGIQPSMKDLPEIPQANRPASVSVGPDASRRGGEGGVPEASDVAGLELITRGSGKAAPGNRSVFEAGAVMFSRESIEQRRTAVAVPVRLAMLPPAAKEHFGERSVYLVFLERMNGKHYSGETLMWFAAKEQSAMGGRAMHAPVPFRQKDPFSARSKISSPLKGLIRLAAVVGADGFVSGIRVLSGPDDRVNQSMAAAVAGWTFLPALRGGEKIAVDVMLDIPLAMTPEVAASQEGAR